jgi:hypothetical protein
LDKVIGLGKAGCAVAEELTEHPEYRIYKIDKEIDERGSWAIGTYPDMAAYEENFDPTGAGVYLRSIKKDDEVLLVLMGGDPISGCTLKLLQCIHDAKLHVLYICPDRQMLSEIQKRDDKICFNILQQYARSGMFENLILLKKDVVERLMGDVSIQDYERHASHFISYLIAMINYFQHTEPVVSTKISPIDWCRLSTYGVSSIHEEQQEVNLLFPLEAISDLHFFYGIPAQDLDEDPTLMKKIKDHVKSFQNDSVSTSFSVYSTSFDDMMVLCTATSPRIQAMTPAE